MLMLQAKLYAGTSNTAQEGNDDDGGGEWTVISRKKTTRQSTAEPLVESQFPHLESI